MAEQQAVVCGNPECKVAVDGKCVEGISPVTTCSHYGKPPSNVGLAPTTSGKHTGIPLALGEVLDIAAADRIFKARPSRLISTIGPNDAGKTSLIASMYEMFQRGPYSGFQFAQSETLIAFERQCHLARVACRRKTPRMERTPRGPAKHFHLGLSSASGTLDLLLADRNGEDYKAVRDSLDAAADFVEIRRADFVTVLVDGRRLTDNADRHNVASELKMILQGMVESGSLGAEHPLGLVLSKYDHVHASPNRDRALGDFRRLFDQLQALFGSRIKSLTSFLVAAAPHDPSFGAGHGLEALLAAWSAPKDVTPHESTLLAQPGRIFERLQITTARSQT